MDDAASPSENRPRDGESAVGGWGAAIVLGGLVMVAAVLGFVVIPHFIVTFLSSRVVPQTRDGLVLLWEAVVFVALSWVFVRLQRGRAR